MGRFGTVDSRQSPLRVPLAGLRQHVADESVDLVYLDPAFNSEQDYNAPFAEHGVKAAAQIKAFLTDYLECRWYVNGERATFGAALRS